MLLTNVLSQLPRKSSLLRQANRNTWKQECHGQLLFSMIHTSQRQHQKQYTVCISLQWVHPQDEISNIALFDVNTYNPIEQPASSVIEDKCQNRPIKRILMNSYVCKKHRNHNHDESNIANNVRIKEPNFCETFLSMRISSHEKSYRCTKQSSTEFCSLEIQEQNLVEKRRYEFE